MFFWSDEIELFSTWRLDLVPVIQALSWDSRKPRQAGNFDKLRSPTKKAVRKFGKLGKKWQLHPLRLPPTLCTTNNPNTNRIGILTMKTGHLCLSWKILTKRTSKWPKLRPLILSLVKVGTNRLDHHPHAHPDPRVFTSLWKCRPPIHCHPMLS